ncbi:4-hydroxybenzoate octaprenyltransferase (plasmid) [Alicycliphilus denitrificans]|uniref:4-hydroxybenzoate octaprenyltransferase n=1 Tax=Alicycliphilus denitrificans TaxID=179636 RepID=A0A858ZND5_9BURK|nr:4-hydroxybenzoate octaprenyltransferase [Alicycliphilus denitrificans]QKD42081.1 4-hydroxybenzoate octaprenyltransferase [Alicycliphilus denitrificans]QKD42109.1 4-hydroxybenzoate octaprenyltransferase [Alicycliphilus denitrificans]
MRSIAPRGDEPSRLALYRDLIRWDRPAGWLLLLWPSLSALWVSAEGFPGWHLVSVFVLGTILMRSAGCCFNDVADRDFDRHVKRTAARPVTTGALNAAEALCVGSVLFLVAFGLVLTTNAAAVAWSVVALGVSLAYPYAKRIVSMPQAVLGIAYSFGILMAFSAVREGPDWSLESVLDLRLAWGAIPPLGWAMFLGNLFWVIAYDTEYAMVDRDDDLRIGIKTAAITLGRWDVVGILLCYLVFIATWSFSLRPVLRGPVFLVGVLAALAQVIWHAVLIRRRTREGCFKAFQHNHWIGCAMFAGIAASYMLR